MYVVDNWLLHELQTNYVQSFIIVIYEICKTQEFDKILFKLKMKRLIYKSYQLLNFLNIFKNFKS